MNKATFKKTAAEMAEYIEHTQGAIQNLQEENAELRKQASMSKTASALPKVDMDSVENMVDSSIEAGFIKEAERQTAVNAVAANPGSLIAFVDKLATNSIEKTASAARPLGRAVGTSAPRVKPGERESDRLFEEKFNHFASRH